MGIFDNKQLISKRRMDFMFSCNFKNILLLESDKDWACQIKPEMSVWKPGKSRIISGLKTGINIQSVNKEIRYSKIKNPNTTDSNL